MFVLLAFATTILAQDQPADKPSADGGRTELKKAAATQDVQEDLESPDGVSLQLLPAGGWRLYGRGSGTYDFNEADEIRGATQDATLRAKAAIAKFLKERVDSTEVMNNISTKLKKLSAKSGEGQQTEISKTDVQTRVESVVAHSDEILRGLVVIESKKKPIGNGGTITVTVGVSSKTEAVSDAIRSGKPVSGSSASGGTDTNSVGTLGTPNLPETNKSKTDF